MNSIYRNGRELSRLPYFRPHLMIDKDSVQFSLEGGMDVITVATDGVWSATTENEWIALSISNDTLVVSVQAQEEILEGSVTVSASNEYGVIVTETISVKVSSVQWVKSVYLPTGSSAQSSKLDTGVVLTTDTVIRCEVYFANSSQGEQLIGMYRKTNDDSADFRWFDTNENWMYYDIMTSRWSKSYSFVAGSFMDVTIGNNYVSLDGGATKFLDGTKITSGSIFGVDTYSVNMYYLKTKSIRIWDREDGKLIYNGKAGIYNGVAGIYDTISGSFKTLNGMQYEE